MTAIVNIEEIVEGAMAKYPAVNDVINFTGTNLQALNLLMTGLKDQGLSPLQLLSVQSTVGGAMVEDGLKLMREAREGLVNLREGENGGVSDGGTSSGNGGTDGTLAS